MTINSETRVAGPFDGNDSTVSFPFTFKVFDSDEVRVVVETGAVETDLELGTDYTVTLNADQNAAPGGSVVLVAPLPTGTRLTLTSALEMLQPVDLTNQGGFYPRVINSALDRLTILLQQLASVVSRTLKFPLSDGPVGDLPGRSARAGTVLAFDEATGEPVAGPDIASVAGVAGALAAINTVSDSIVDVNTVSDSIVDVNTVADNITDVNTVAGSIADVNTVADNIADVNTVADNIADVTNFSDVYYGPSASAPTTRRDGTPLQEGDLYFNTTAETMRVYDGSTWREATGGSITVDTFSGDGSTVAFELGTTPANESLVQVFVGGVYQQRSTYSVVGATLTFDAAPPPGTNNIEAIVTSAIPSDDVLRGELQAPTGAGLVGYAPVGAGGSPRTVLAKLRDTVSVLDYEDEVVGGDWHPAFAAAISAVQTAGGGRVRIPAGTYTLNQALTLAPSGGWQNIILEGDGPSSVLDFSGCAPSTDGIRVLGYGGRFWLRDFTILGARRHGLNINAGITRGDPQWVLSFAVSGLRVEDCLGDGVRMIQTYMGDFQDVECWNNGGIGFQLFGFHTSMNFNKCWSTQNTYGTNVGPGWKINGLTYSCFNSCGSDSHAGSGWEISNVAGVTWNGCGSEGNGADGFAFSTGADTSGMPAIASGIKGAILDGCFTIGNSKATIGAYACHVSIGTSGGVPASVTMRGNTSGRSEVADVSLVYIGASGTIDVVEDLNNMDGATVTSGTVRVTNRTVQGRVALAVLSANQSVPNATETTANFAAFSANTLEATLSGGTIVIPAGVRRVRVTAGVYWAASATGSRIINFTRNAAGAAGLPMLKSAGGGLLGQNISSAVIDVSAGDSIGLVLYQDSGAALNALQSGRTFLAVEAIG